MKKADKFNLLFIFFAINFASFNLIFCQEKWICQPPGMAINDATCKNQLGQDWTYIPPYRTLSDCPMGREMLCRKNSALKTATPNPMSPFSLDSIKQAIEQGKVMLNCTTGTEQKLSMIQGKVKVGTILNPLFQPGMTGAKQNCDVYLII